MVRNISCLKPVLVLIGGIACFSLAVMIVQPSIQAQLLLLFFLFSSGPDTDTAIYTSISSSKFTDFG